MPIKVREKQSNDLSHMKPDLPAFGDSSDIFWISACMSCILKQVSTQKIDEIIFEVSKYRVMSTPQKFTDAQLSCVFPEDFCLSASLALQNCTEVCRSRIFEKI